MAAIICPSLSFSIFTVGIQPTKQKRQLFQIKQIDRQEERLPGVLTAGGSSYSTTTTTSLQIRRSAAPAPLQIRRSGAAPHPCLCRPDPALAHAHPHLRGVEARRRRKRLEFVYLRGVSGGGVVEKWRWKRERPVSYGETGRPASNEEAGELRGEGGGRRATGRPASAAGRVGESERGQCGWAVSERVEWRGGQNWKVSIFRY